ncbi:hypothetical protein [Curtobacterium sp. MCPF17_052]|uniref:hypothetical protein n=1 Tax=Curtobacterium sp. MCPF17_052 TaxID=2175655 RepID=UPI003464D6BC
MALTATGCSIQVRSEPDPSIGKDTMLINADHGNPLFDRNFNPYITNARTASKWMYEPLIEVNPPRRQAEPVARQLVGTAGREDDRHDDPPGCRVVER